LNATEIKEERGGEVERMLCKRHSNSLSKFNQKFQPSSELSSTPRQCTWTTGKSKVVVWTVCST